MPCNTIVTNQISFQVAGKNETLRLRAIDAEFKTTGDRNAAGEVWFQADDSVIRLVNGQASVSGRSEAWLGERMDRLKRAYSQQAVREAARRAGFQVKAQQGDQNHLVIERRAI